MNCPCCSAPLPSRSLVCAYCGSRVDVDLQGWARMESCGSLGNQLCPDGHGLLQEVILGREARLSAGRCATCLGLFVPSGTLEQLLSDAVGPVWEVNHPLLQQLAEAPRGEERPVRYRRCPVCHELMTRRLFGRRSGVILDRCRDHGSWLEAGELRQLLEWGRAGGHLHHRECLEREAEELGQRRERATDTVLAGQGDPSWLEADLLELLGRALGRLVR